MDLNQRKRVLFLDFDGTLAQTIPGLQRSLEKLCERLNLPYSESLFDKYQGATLDEIFLDLFPQSDEPVDKDETRNFYFREVQAAYATSALSDGVEELLFACKDLSTPCWIVTSAPSALLHVWLAHHSLSESFAGLVCGDDVAEHKPSPMPYLEAIRRSGADASRSLAVEDSANGAKSAQGAGLKVVLVAEKPVPMSEEPFARIQAFREVLPLLKNFSTVSGHSHIRPLPKPWQLSLLEEPLRFSPATQKAIDAEWNSAVARAPAGRFFEGPTLVVRDSDFKVAPATYRLTLALRSPRIHALPELAPWRALSVTGVVECDSGFLFGKRGNVAGGAGLWELLPSGGIEPKFISGSTIDVEAQFLAELKEETGISAASVKKLEPVALLAEDHHTLDIVVRARVSELPRAQGNEEYLGFEVVPQSEIASFAKAHAMLPATAALLRWLGIL